jgi:uncharacterized protein YbjT (DUF2867 family)
MIVVSGATGKLGSLVVEGLLGRVPAEQIGVSVRDPERADELAARGVRVRRGDFAEPSTLAGAFEGATQVLLVSVNAIGPEKVAQHRAAVDAAYAAGAKRVLYTSHQGAGAGSLFAPMVDHAATEAYLAELGSPFTALRNGYYADTIPLLFGRALETGELVAPADGPVSWTAHVDLAEAAVRVLTDEARFDGPTPPLTAPEVFDLEQVAAILGELSGRTVRRVVVDDEEWVAGLVAQGSPEARASMLLGMFQASRRGEFAVTDPALEELLGRPATSLRAFLSDRVASGLGGRG